MKAKVARWGNSLALRIPKHLAEARDLSEGSDVEFTEHENELRIRPVRSPKYTLSELLKKVTSANVHREFD